MTEKIPYSIQVFFTNDNGDRVKVIYHTDMAQGETLGQMYKKARASFGDGYTFGACLQGHAVIF